MGVFFANAVVNIAYVCAIITSALVAVAFAIAILLQLSLVVAVVVEYQNWQNVFTNMEKRRKKFL